MESPPPPSVVTPSPPPPSSSSVCSALPSFLHAPCSLTVEYIDNFVAACRVGHPLAIAAIGSAVFVILVIVASLLSRHSGKKTVGKYGKAKRAAPAKAKPRVRRPSGSSDRKAEDQVERPQDEPRAVRRAKGGNKTEAAHGGDGEEAKEGEEADGWKVVVGRRRKGGGRPSM
eukprot:GHVS01063200.1.p1 GENE.GHVS01063200.1~~GHVS01063200.1.p1  ORF type:complete len:172 (-),score=47.56 GHVS01063200.1:90-605(-)